MKTQIGEKQIMTYLLYVLLKRDLKENKPTRM